MSSRTRDPSIGVNFKRIRTIDALLDPCVSKTDDLAWRDYIVALFRTQERREVVVKEGFREYGVAVKQPDTPTLNDARDRILYHWVTLTSQPQQASDAAHGPGIALLDRLRKDPLLIPPKTQSAPKNEECVMS
jgi:hypothetical protein